MTEIDKGITREWVAAICNRLSEKDIRPTCIHVSRHSNGRSSGLWIEGFSSSVLESELISLLDSTADDDAVLDVVLGYGDRSILRDGTVRLPKKIERGLTGLAIFHTDRLIRVCPSTMLIKNKGYSEAIDVLIRSVSSDGRLSPVVDASGTDNTDVITFSTVQFIIPSLEPGSIPIPAYRGKPIVPLESISLQGVEALAGSLSAWMLRHVAANGKLTYCYHPSEDKYDPNTNRIREFMGSIALNKAARFFGDREMSAIAEKNLKYNLKEYYRDETAYGVIIEGSKIKLGAASLAALAIRLSTHRVIYTRQESQLMRLTRMMWQETGMFRTFLRPTNRNDDCQNFYPGETLLLWAECWIETREMSLWEQIERSFDYYQDWHRRHKNPAFIPWHTQAYFLLWQVTRDRKFRDFIFEMNDWLIAFQQWDQAEGYPDTQGRFFDPDKPYGPPHASFTGVYLEGLIDAFKLAKEENDDERAQIYARTIRRGLRNVLQLQFSELYECAALPCGEKALGGVRTTEYNNVIRVDNVQHNLMAALKLLDVTNFYWS